MTNKVYLVQYSDRYDYQGVLGIYASVGSAIDSTPGEVTLYNGRGATLYDADDDLYYYVTEYEVRP
jgi:peptidoglycan hydrolase-like amidase